MIKKLFISKDNLNIYTVHWNLKLMSDIWVPVLDIVLYSFLLKSANILLANWFLLAMLQILAQFITIHYKLLGNQKNNIKLKSLAIEAADLNSSVVSQN